MNTTILLSELIEQEKNIMLKNGYSKRSIVNYSTVWNQYNKYCSNKNIKTYSKKLRKEFLIKHYNFNLENDISKHQRSIIKRLDILDNISNGLDMHYKISKKESVPDININIYYNYITYLSKTLKLSNI